jgi:hypothetical protein
MILARLPGKDHGQRRPLRRRERSPIEVTSVKAANAHRGLHRGAVYIVISIT